MFYAVGDFMKYKVGNRVRVRKDIECGYYLMDDGIREDCVVKDMLEFRGKMVTISYADGKYKIKEDGGNFWWVDGMFGTSKCFMA